ncbi:hypothetical protein [Streptomyces sp. JNUCC 63]
MLRVTFAFACTGNATASLRIEVDGKDVESAAGTHKCGTSVFQQSLEMSNGGSVGFSADVKGSHEGGFAYSYYTEKKQLP